MPSERLYGRNGRIWADYVGGMTQEALADKYEISQSRVSEVIRDVRDSIPEAVRAEVIQREVEMLDQLRVEVLELWRRPPIPAYSNGRPVLMADGVSIAEDHTYRLRALDTALKVQERTARLLGLDAATKLEATVTTEESDAVAALAAEAARRVAGETAT